MPDPSCSIVCSAGDKYVNFPTSTFEYPLRGTGAILRSSRHECTAAACGIVALSGRGENRHGNFREQADHTTVVRFCWRGTRGATVTEMLDLEAWFAWIRSLDTGWLFLLILVFVVAVVGLWSRSLKSEKTRESKYD